MGIRIDSSNYDPTPAWAAGNQLVAMNWQTNDLAYEINIGRFMENGNCGYVLKPEYMLNDKAVRSPGVKLTVRIISGQQLPKPGGAEVGEVVDPFVAIHINGVPIDTAHYQTKTSIDNGFNPVWNEVLIVDCIILYTSYIIYI